LAEREAAWRRGVVADFIEADAALHMVIVNTAHNSMLSSCTPRSTARSWPACDARSDQR
jgi:DNA-binding FadR family transcriptional regulator